MLDNDVHIVSISLSGKLYSKKLEEWLMEHKEQIMVYASYNNLPNTFDYPAKYDTVIGVGTYKVIDAKNIDILYSTNKIFVISSKKHFYEGNSFLTPYTMIKQSVNK